MSQIESITELQSQLAHLERHVTEQDAEFYQLAKRLDALSQLVHGISDVLLPAHAPSSLLPFDTMLLPVPPLWQVLLLFCGQCVIVPSIVLPFSPH